MTMLSQTQEEKKTTAHMPGSAAAISAGCNCPVFDNSHGKGWLCSGLYIMRDDCPIHGIEPGEPSQPDCEHAGQWLSPNAKVQQRAEKQ